MAVKTQPLRVILLFALVGIAAFSIPLKPEDANGIAAQDPSSPTLRFLTKLDSIYTNGMPR